jgi:hypothetical protein
MIKRNIFYHKITENYIVTPLFEFDISLWGYKLRDLNKMEGYYMFNNNDANPNKAEEAVKNMDISEMYDKLENFNEFKSYLHNKIAVGEKLGMNEEQLAKSAEKVADYLAKNTEPQNREEVLLQELWKVGNEEERHKLAHMLVKLAK